MVDSFNLHQLNSSPCHEGGREGAAGAPPRPRSVDIYLVLAERGKAPLLALRLPKMCNRNAVPSYTAPKPVVW